MPVNKWNSFEEVFDVLNSMVNYVILRNFEELPQNFDQNVHKSIDILTDNPERLIRILNPPNIEFALRRSQVSINVGECQILWDIRHVGDGYYCLQWEQDMLQDKVLSPAKVSVLNDEHYFYSLVYHALVHKESISKDYYVKAEHLLDSLFQGGNLPIKTTERESFLGIFDFYFDLLSDHMNRKKYKFCSPQRAEYNPAVVHLSQIATRLEKQFGLKKVKPIHLTRLGGLIPQLKKNTVKLENCLTYYQACLNDKKIFIKYGGYEGDCKNEFEYSHRLHSKNQNNFVEVLFYSELERFRCIASEFLEGKTLEDAIQSTDCSSPERESIILQLKNIAKCLIETGVVHRDAGADNFIVTQEGKLKLIDFGGAVDGSQPGVCAAFKRDSLFFRRVCVKCKHRWHCCDVFVLPLMLERIGIQESYQETYREVETFLREHPSTIVVRCKYRYIFYRILSRLKKVFQRCFLNRWRYVIE